MLARVAGQSFAASWVGSSLIPATLAYSTVKVCWGFTISAVFILCNLLTWWCFPTGVWLDGLGESGPKRAGNENERPHTLDPRATFQVNRPELSLRTSPDHVSKNNIQI